MVGGQPTSSSLYLHIHKSPTPVGCGRQPSLSPVLASAAELTVRWYLALRRGKRLPLPSHRCQDCLGRKQGNQNHFLAMTLCA